MCKFHVCAENSFLSNSQSKLVDQIVLTEPARQNAGL